MVKINWEKFPNKWLGSNVSCSREVQRKFYAIFNEDFMSALNNFAKKENSDIFFTSINDDMFHNANMSVHGKNNLAGNSKSYPLKLDIDSRDNFVKSMRSIYNCAAEAVKGFAKR